MHFLRKNSSYLTLVGLALLSVGIWSQVFAETPPGALTIAIIQAGDTKSFYIESPTGVRVLVNGGSDGSILGMLPKVMPLASRHFDAVIETHPNTGYIAGLLDVLKRYRVGYFIEPGIPKATLVAQALEKEIYDQKITRVFGRAGAWLDLGGGAKLLILSPDFDPTLLPANKTIKGAITLRLIYKKFSFDISPNEASSTGALPSDVKLLQLP
jgi:competence protein ComEC